jgi:hypothetical protein
LIYLHRTGFSLYCVVTRNPIAVKIAAGPPAKIAMNEHRRDDAACPSDTIAPERKNLPKSSKSAGKTSVEHSLVAIVRFLARQSAEEFYQQASAMRKAAPAGDETL